MNNKTTAPQRASMDAITREHARSLSARADKVKEAIEAVRVARAAEEAACAEDGDERGRTRARRELAELAEYHSLRDYFTAGEALREAVACTDAVDDKLARRTCPKCQSTDAGAACRLPPGPVSCGGGGAGWAAKRVRDVP